MTAIVKDIHSYVKRTESLSIGDIVEVKDAQLGVRGVVLKLLGKDNVYVKWPSGCYRKEQSSILRKITYGKHQCIG